MQQLTPTPGQTCDACLRTLLAGGPRNSRDVLAELAARQFTPKQARRARERLGVLIERAGNGKGMHSAWRLPSGKATAPTGGSTTSTASTARASSRILAPPGRADQSLPGGLPLPTPTASTTASTTTGNEGEQRRHRARVLAFMALGNDATTAQAVADALVGRDRAGLRALGSCAECQNLARRQCPATPRPVTEIHECWTRRQSTP